MSEPSPEQMMREHRAARHAWMRTVSFLNAAGRDWRNFVTAMGMLAALWMMLDLLWTWLLLRHR